ncbi:MAG: c-type cytochrome, partial [Bacteroidetes bacterium]|nr:c-type cytochrome [Bacteroidota bacterium]
IWPTLGPEARKQAGNIFIYDEANHDLLLTALESGEINMGELNLDLERRRALLFSDNQQIKQRAEALFTDAGVVQRREAIQKMRPALELAGNNKHGSELFMTNCSSCHQYGDKGQNVGPVLTEISRKSRESLLHDILDPNAAVDTRYVNHQVKTQDGKIYLGIISRETDTEITLQSMGGQEVTLGKNQVESLTSQGISMMPEGLEEGMSVQDMADLLAFLQGK